MGGQVTLPGRIEDHLLAEISIEHNFGHPLTAEPQQSGTLDATDHLANEALFLYANQPQTFLSQGYLCACTGFGIDLARQIKHWIDIDAGALMFPGGDAANYQDGGTLSEVFVGFKAGIRRDHFGIFYKLRPGFATFPDTVDMNYAAPPYVRSYVRTFDFALDSGAVIELYPTGHHLVLRFDLGEVTTEYAAVKVTSFQGIGTQPSQAKVAGLYTFGAGWRF